MTEMEKSSTWIDAYGAEYSADRLILLKGPQTPNLSKYRIEKGTQIIGEGAFMGCTALQSIDIPDSVTDIGEGAFSCDLFASPK
mgnify:CR=1 FL=1